MKKWIWIESYDPAKLRRVDQVSFKREFKLKGRSGKAFIRLSSRLNYHLIVNGNFVGYGPARSYPEFHELDEYNLRPFLTEGSNSVEVVVLHWNHATFHRLLEAPGFIAAGEIVDADGTTYTLETLGEWMCRRNEGVDVTAPRLSFAQGAVEIIDMRCKPGEWRKPVLTDPGVTEQLRPRSIPLLTDNEMPAIKYRVAKTLDDEIIVGGRVVSDGEDNSNPQPAGYGHAVMAAWIYSDIDRAVTCGTWWADYLLNGEPPEKRPEDELPLRSKVVINLKSGWNKLVATQQPCFGYAEFCLAVPKKEQVVFKTAKADDAPDGVLISKLLNNDEFNNALLVLREPESDLPELGWRTVPTDSVAESPLRHIVWSQPAEKFTEVKTPIEIEAKQPALITVDLGKIVLGRIFFDIDAPEGTVLDFGHAEDQKNDRAFISKTVVMYGADRRVLPGKRKWIETFSPRGFRFIDVLISNHSSPVTLHGAGVVEQRYPYSFTGEFECSEEDFNTLWKFGRRSLELCSEDVFTDCPWRERTLYGGDLLPEMGTAAVLSRDLRIVRHSLEVLLQSVNEKGWMHSRAPVPRGGVTLSDYPLLTSIATDWYVGLTHDRDFAARAWRVFKSMSEAISTVRMDNGLYTPPSSAFIDHGREIQAGPTCEFNVALVASFRAWANIGRTAGALVQETEKFAQLANELDALIADTYFDKEALTFRDLPVTDGENRTEGTPANTWALLFSRNARIHADDALNAISKTMESFDPENEPESVSPYQMFYLLSALGLYNRADIAESAIRQVYARMLDEPTGTLWEASRPAQSLTHAWSSAINHYFATTVLGVKMGLTDCEDLTQIRIAPCADSIRWARGVVPHPLGTVKVDWKIRDGTLYISVNAPSDVRVSVTPAGPLADMPCVINGK
jgi:alpha-L-rhamnosidase